MRRYDEDTCTLLPEEYATSAEACAAWASALAAEGHALCDRASMLTCAGDSWARWTMARTGDPAPLPEWTATACESARAPRSTCDHCSN